MTSATAITAPLETFSPTLTRNSFTTPAWLEGISMEALSVSMVIRDCSTVMLSPGLIRTSAITTSLKSPMSGTLSSMLAMLIERSLQ